MPTHATRNKTKAPTRTTTTPFIFTHAAADEMERRALKALKERGMAAKDVKALRVVTFHGLGHQMLREKLERAPQELNQRLISGEPRQWLAEDIIRPWRSDRSRKLSPLVTMPTLFENPQDRE